VETRSSHVSPSSAVAVVATSHKAEVIIELLIVHFFVLRRVMTLGLIQILPMVDAHASTKHGSPLIPDARGMPLDTSELHNLFLIVLFITHLPMRQGSAHPPMIYPMTRVRVVSARL
jgi:hypothetical protein